MIQLLQLQLYNPDPVSISNIGHSNIGHLKYWPLPGFSSRRLITSSTWEYVWPQQTSVGSMRESDICTCVSKMSQSRVKSPALQGVSWEVPLDRLLDWVGALEELFASLLAIGSLGSVHVFVQQLPEVIRHVQDLKVSGHPEKVWCENVLKITVLFTYWKPDFSLLDILPKYSGSLITSQINFFWHSRSL